MSDNLQWKKGAIAILPDGAVSNITGVDLVDQMVMDNRGEWHRMKDVTVVAQGKSLLLGAFDLLKASERILDGGYVSQYIEEERADYEQLSAAIAKATP